MVRDLDLREGDTVYASQVPGLLNTPLIVGEISTIKPHEMDPLLWDITVEIAEDLSRLTDVTVIIADEALLKNSEQ